MDVLCTDKTGTLTEGRRPASRARTTPSGRPSADGARPWPSATPACRRGLVNPIDEAMLRGAPARLDRAESSREIPYDFVRKRLSVVVRCDGRCPAPHEGRRSTPGARGLHAYCRTARRSTTSRRGRRSRRVPAWSEDGHPRPGRRHRDACRSRPRYTPRRRVRPDARRLRRLHRSAQGGRAARALADLARARRGGQDDHRRQPAGRAARRAGGRARRRDAC